MTSWVSFGNFGTGGTEVVISTGTGQVGYIIFGFFLTPPNMIGFQFANSSATRSPLQARR